MRKKIGIATVCILSALIGSSGRAETLRLATIAPGTSAYLVMTSMANLVNQNQDQHQIYVNAAGASTKHMIDAAQGSLDFVLTTPATYAHMAAGDAMYSELQTASELSDNLKLVFWFPMGAIHTIAHADSGIETLADLQGRRVFLGPLGSGAFEAASTWITATTGLQVGVDFEPVDASWDAAYQGFQGGQIDVYMVSGTAPFPQVENLARRGPIRLLGLTREEAENANTAVLDATAARGMSLDEIDTSKYGTGVVTSQTVYSMGMMAGVAVRSDLSDQVVYDVTKTFWENLGPVRAGEPAITNVTLDRAFDAANLKLHSGALRYYTEIDLPIPPRIK